MATPTSKALRARVLMGAYERAARAELRVRKFVFNRASGPEKTRGYITWVSVAELLDSCEIDYYGYCAWWMVFWLQTRDRRTVRTTTPPIGMLANQKAMDRYRSKFTAHEVTHLALDDAEHWMQDAVQIIRQLQKVVVMSPSEIVEAFWTAIPAEFLAVCGHFHAGCTAGTINTHLNPSHYQVARRYYAAFREAGRVAALQSRVTSILLEVQNAG